MSISHRICSFFKCLSCFLFHFKYLQSTKYTQRIRRHRHIFSIELIRSTDTYLKTKSIYLSHAPHQPTPYTTHTHEDISPNKREFIALSRDILFHYMWLKLNAVEITISIAFAMSQHASSATWKYIYNTNTHTQTSPLLFNPFVHTIQFKVDIYIYMCVENSLQNWYNWKLWEFAKVNGQSKWNTEHILVRYI